ncbi:MAG: NADH-quinone oxidoreductase subunit A [Ktedonobacterales bacterium]|nr:NADH-quinone oxidoreductase subunit A [Ktedonobacterales bacterium]
MPAVIPVLILMALAFLFSVFVIAITFILGPKRPTPEKAAPYESGIRNVEAPHGRFPVKYLVTGMLFIIFDVEAASIIPLAILMRQLKVQGLVELTIFAVILFIPFFYVWRKGAFTWE